MTNNEMIAKILALAKQSKWYKWDEVINLDLKWKEIMYSFSPRCCLFSPTVSRILYPILQTYEDGTRQKTILVSSAIIKTLHKCIYCVDARPLGNKEGFHGGMILC